MTATSTPVRERSAAYAIPIPGPDLQRLAEAVIPHAASDAGRPALSAVQWEIRRGVLWLAATDTRTLGAARWPAGKGSPADAGPVLLSAGETAALAEAAGPGAATVSIDPEPGMITVISQTAAYRARWPCPRPEDIPDWRQVLAGLIDGTPAVAGRNQFAFEPAHLARFSLQSARAGRPGELRLLLRRHQRNRELVYLVTCEDWFIGAITPAKVSAGFDPAAVLQLWGEHLSAGPASWRDR